MNPYTFPILHFCLFSLLVTVVSGQVRSFPTVLIQNEDSKEISTSLIGSHDDGTLLFQTPEKDTLVPGIVYSVIEGNQELAQVEVKSLQNQIVLTKPVRGKHGFGKVTKGVSRRVVLKPINPQIPEPVPLRMNQLEVDVQVMANLAVTTLTMNFRNDLDRVLEGELKFPLGEGQTVSRFAMTVGGKLREGVVVEKAEGRKIFEDIVRRGIDPGLLELTRGNVFKARVYPIPARGNKKIVVAYEQELQDIGNGYIYNLPLDFPGVVDHFSINVDVLNQAEQPILAGSELTNLRFQRWQNSWKAGLQVRNYRPNQDLSFAVPKYQHVERVFVEEEGGTNYFYVTFTPQVVQKMVNKPGKITVVWDTSLSGLKRNISKELSVLQGYLLYLQNVQVDLLVFRNEMAPVLTFNVQNGKADELLNTIKQLQYDGGTQLGALKLKKFRSDQFLLFSDGISNFGQHNIQHGKTPLFAINSSSVAEHGYLRYISQATGGSYLNLTKLTQLDAVGKLMNKPYMFLSATHDSRHVRETYPKTRTPVQGAFSISGILDSPKALVVLEFGIGKRVMYRKNIIVDMLAHKTESGMARRIWAQKKIEELELNPKLNKDIITEVGKTHSIVTRNTSLIVLDRYEDYLSHRILPPEPEMQERYLSEVEIAKAKKKSNESIQLSKVYQQFENRIAQWYITSGHSRESLRTWHEQLVYEGRQTKEHRYKIEYLLQKKRFNEEEKRKMKALHAEFLAQEKRLLSEQIRVMRVLEKMPTKQDQSNRLATQPPAKGTADPFGTREPSPPVIPSIPAKPFKGPASGGVDPFGPSPRGLNSQETAIKDFFLRSGVPVSDPDSSISFDGKNLKVRHSPESQKIVENALSRYTQRQPSLSDVQEGQPVKLINLKKWDPETPYLKRLTTSPPDDWYKIYLEERELNMQSSAFFLDVADFFRVRTRPDLSLRILSNIAEMDLENPRLLRILGHRLMQTQHKALAVSVFEQVLEMREEDPQSYRDLALALASVNQHQRAVDLLYKVVKGTWHPRFPGIQMIALNEMNAIIATCNKKLYLDKMDKRLIRNLPMDVRVVLTWDADNTDMDLYVTDPTGVTCSYQQRATPMGGRISPDFTGGYGPEEFLLRNAQPGKYEVRVQYYGNRQQNLSGTSTIQVSMTTNFGQSNEKTQSTTIRMREEKEMIKIGEFFVPKKEPKKKDKVVLQK